MSGRSLRIYGIVITLSMLCTVAKCVQDGERPQPPTASPKERSHKPMLVDAALKLALRKLAPAQLRANELRISMKRDNVKHDWFFDFTFVPVVPDGDRYVIVNDNGKTETFVLP